MVVALRRKGQELNSDSRILGSSDFVNHILDETTEENHQLKARHPRKNISDIITERKCRIRYQPEGFKKWKQAANGDPGTQSYCLKMY